MACIVFCGSQDPFEKGAAFRSTIDKLDRGIWKHGSKNNPWKACTRAQVNPVTRGGLNQLQGLLCIDIMVFEGTRAHEVHRPAPLSEEGFVVVE